MRARVEKVESDNFSSESAFSSWIVDGTTSKALLDIGGV